MRFLAQWLVGVLALTSIGFTVPQSASAAPRVSPWPTPTIVSTSPLSGAALVTWTVAPAPGGVPGPVGASDPWPRTYKAHIKW